MLVRLATESDLPEITEINDWYIAQTSSNFNIDPVGEDAMRADWLGTCEKYPWLVAVDPVAPGTVSLGEGQKQLVVGFAKASAWKGRCAYDWSAEVTVYVHHAHNGKGVGSALYERLFTILREQGYRSLLAGITQPNEASVHLHEKMGMRRVGYHQRVGWKFEAWHDVGHWQLSLGDPDSPPPPIRSVAAVYPHSPPNSPPR